MRGPSDIVGYKMWTKSIYENFPLYSTEQCNSYILALNTNYVVLHTSVYVHVRPPLWAEPW